jgi:hypothetical protein
MAAEVRNRQYLLLAFATQCLNLLTIVVLARRPDTPVPSLVVAGLGRIVTDGWLLYLSYIGKTWATNVLIALWFLVSVSCGASLLGVWGDPPSGIARFGLVALAVAYILFGVVLGANKPLRGR